MGNTVTVCKYRELYKDDLSVLNGCTSTFIEKTFNWCSKSDGLALEYVPEEVITKELCEIAATNRFASEYVRRIK